MKKNIIIAGTARAGKSTLSSMISRKLGYQHISMDAINSAFEKIFPELDIDTDRDPIDLTSKKITPFINSMLKSGEYDKFDYGMIIDVCQLMPEDYVKYIDSSLADVYFLITDSVTTEERLHLLMEKDDEEEYTYYMNNEELFKLCEESVDESREIKKQCLKHKLPYYDTLYNREDVLETILSRVSKS